MSLLGLYWLNDQGGYWMGSLMLWLYDIIVG